LERRGFTLVEVIVVLVILAILAAIAIPALTGYIDKAQEKKWIAQARDAAVAMRTVFDIAYADGTLGKGLPAPPSSGYDFLEEGKPAPYSLGTIKDFSTYFISRADSGSPINGFMYLQRAAELMGDPYPTGTEAVIKSTPGYWAFDFFAKKPSDFTLLNAPSWVYVFWPDGQSAGKSGIVVTYGFEDIPESADTIIEWWDNQGKFIAGASDPGAGYKVYHVTA
jgi:prepilin-type N-terminal cleavage/methylation domain-containing protein